MSQRQYKEFDDFVEAGLKNLSSRQECGRIVKQHPTERFDFILLFEDDPRNWSGRLSIEKGIHWFLRKRIIDIVGIEGAFPGYVNTTKMTSFPVPEVKGDVALYFLKDLKINAGEYCHAIFEKPYYTSFYLCGVDDPNLYNKSLELFRSQNMPAFASLHKMRAVRMLDNLLYRMEELDRQRAALICSGKLPDFICEEMEKQDISYARIRPRISEPSDFVKYGKLIRGELSPLEKLLCDNMREDSSNKEDEEIAWKTTEDIVTAKVPKRERIQTYVPRCVQKLAFRLTVMLSKNTKTAAVICPPSMFLSFKKKEFALFVPVPYDEEDLFLRAGMGLDPVGPPSREVLTFFSHGNTHFRMQQYDDAIVDYTRAIDIDSAFVQAYFYRGATYDTVQRYDKAIADYTRAIEIDSTYAEAYINRGATYDTVQRYDEAIADYTRAIEIDSTYAEAYINRGITYGNQYLYHQALEDYNHATQLDPINTRAYINRGTCYDRLHDYDQALADYKHAIQLDPTDALAYLNTGALFVNRGKLRKGLRYLEKAAQLGDQRGAQYAAQVRQKLFF